MINLRSLSHPDRKTLNFLKNNLKLSRSLLSECDHDYEKVSTLVGESLEASKPPSSASYYIQAATLGRSAYLTTNLSNLEEARVTEVAPTWLIGRSPNCAIALAHPSISRCHAVIGYSPEQGFYLMDVGSSNGTFLNRRRLPVLERHPLRDGDLISLSHIHVEFFVIKTRKPVSLCRDVTHA